MTVPEKSKHKSVNVSITLDSPPVTPAGYLPLLRVSNAIHIAARRPFRLAGEYRSIFFGFNAVGLRPAASRAHQGFQERARTEKWQIFSVTLRKVSMVTREIAAARESL
jgi:hypothetical protein